MKFRVPLEPLRVIRKLDEIPCPGTSHLIVYPEVITTTLAVPDGTEDGEGMDGEESVALLTGKELLSG